jgi:hypothetical protein
MPTVPNPDCRWTARPFIGPKRPGWMETDRETWMNENTTRWFCEFHREEVASPEDHFIWKEPGKSKNYCISCDAPIHMHNGSWRTTSEFFIDGNAILEYECFGDVHEPDPERATHIAPKDPNAPKRRYSLEERLENNKRKKARRAAKHSQS